MSPAPRERLGRLRAGAAALATVNVVVGAAVLVAGLAPGTTDAVRAAEAAPGPSAPSAPATVLVLAQHPLLHTTTSTTTSTTIPSAPTAARGGIRRVVSTGYCLEGTTASGVPVGPGMVAMNGVALGSRWRVHDGPLRGSTLEVTDRIGHSTEFDIWFDDCADAVAYGRRTIGVERVPG